MSGGGLAPSGNQICRWKDLGHRSEVGLPMGKRPHGHEWKWMEMNDVDIIYVYSIISIIIYNVYYDTLFVWRCRKIITKIRSIIILPIKTVHVGVPRWAYFISGGEDYRLPGSTTFFAFKCWLLSSPLTIVGYQRSMGIYMIYLRMYIYIWIDLISTHAVPYTTISRCNMAHIIFFCNGVVLKLRFTPITDADTLKIEASYGSPRATLPSWKGTFRGNFLKEKHCQIWDLLRSTSTRNFLQTHWLLFTSGYKMLIASMSLRRKGLKFSMTLEKGLNTISLMMAQVVYAQLLCNWSILFS